MLYGNLQDSIAVTIGSRIDARIANSTNSSLFGNFLILPTRIGARVIHHVSVNNLSSKEFDTRLTAMFHRRFPFELEVMVLEWVHRLSQGPIVAPQPLTACALVCKAWTTVAQSLLFRRLTIPDRNPSQLVRMITASDVLGTYVRSIRAPRVDRHLNLYRGISVADFIALLSRCRRIREISVVMYGGELTASELAEIHAFNLPIELLHFPDAGPEFFQLAETWAPTLRFLSLKTSARSRKPPEVEPSNRIPFTLRGIEVANDLDLAVIPWLLHAEEDSQALEIGVQYHTLDGLGTLEVHATRIVSFKSPSAPARNVLEQLTSLEEFILQDLPSKPLVLPPSVRHVGLHPELRHPVASRLDSPDGMDYLFDALSALPRLSLVSATRFANAEMLKFLESRCHEIGVDFIAYENPSPFPYLAPPDRRSTPRTKIPAALEEHGGDPGS
ncbi:hypothetical protein BV25DRAFT_1840971 [Artomyces pyxidatus]|uniref:Uncharacterized protein n=1 Tax=Artomyces pyxidatus TaxID=48021 RepID=A0ACB8SPB0_9AGAM|nr:hypothetical protein BV25DRAFT_1840971 [Artomyces pyxidatus]